jgi:hypothetical protein
VLDALSAQSALAWPILKTQCELLACDPASLKPEDLPNLVPRLREALARFTSPGKGLAFQRELERDDAYSAPASPTNAFSSQTGFSPPTELGELTKEVLRILGGHTPLAWPIVEVQCSKAHINPKTLNKRELESLIPAFTRSLARFSTPQKAQVADAELRRLL